MKRMHLAGMSRVSNDDPILFTGICMVVCALSSHRCSRTVNPSVSVPIPSGTISCNVLLISHTFSVVIHLRLRSMLYGAHSAGTAGASSSVSRIIWCSLIFATRLLTVFFVSVSVSVHADSDDSGHSSLNSCRYSCKVMSQCCAVSRIRFLLSFVEL